MRKNRLAFPLVSAPLLGAVAVVALAVVAPNPALAGRVDVPLRTGTSDQGTIERAGAVSTAAFLVLEGPKRNLSISVKKAKRSSLLPDVTVFDPDGNEVDFPALGGKAKVKPTSFKAKLKSVPRSGLWRVEVRGADDSTGDYVISASSKDNASSKGSTVVILGGSASVPVTAGDGYSLTIATKRSKGSSIIPDVELIDPNGNVLTTSVGAASQNTKKGTAKLKKFALPTFGDYVVRFVGDQGTGGGLSYSIKTTPTKFKGARPEALPGPSRTAEPGIDGTLDASASRPSVDGRQLTPIWTQVSGPQASLSDPSSMHPTFRAPDTAASLAYQLSVLEAGVPSEPKLVVVEVALRPIADPGRARRVAPGSTVTLDAGASFDRSARGLDPEWRVIDGSVVLDDPRSPTPSFTAPAVDEVVRVGLVVDDGTARSFEAEQTIVVAGAARATADAGREQYVGRMSSVFLSGLASERATGTLDGGAAWTQIAGPTVTLAGADTFTPSFTAPRQSTDLLFELVVDDDAETKTMTWVHVRPDESNAAPVTIVNGPQLAGGGSAAFDASGSFDVDGDPLAHRWTVVDGSGATLSAPDAAIGTATGLTEPTGRWILASQTRDDLQYGPPEFLRVIGPSYTGAPLAFAGPNRTVTASSTVGLDGSLSASAGGGSLSFAWRQISGTDWYDVAAEDVSFDATSDRPQFRLPFDLSSLTARRSLTFELVVSDANGPSAPDVVTLTFTGLPLNSAPVAVASASEPRPLPGAVVALTGSVSDRDGDAVAPMWTQVSGPAVNLSPDRNALSPSFVAPAAGTLVFDLVGNDGFTDGPPSRVTVTVDEKPVALATATPPDGPAATIVRFDAGNSFDPEGEQLLYTWTQIGGTSVSFDANAESFQVQSPVGGMSFRLVVNDGRQDSDAVQIGFADETPPSVAPTTDKSSAPYAATVQLQANPSDADPATFTWRQINASGTDPVVTLSSTTALNPTFSVPLPSGGAFGSAPSATFGVKATRADRDSEEKTVVVQFFASYNDSSLSANNRVYGIISQSCTSCHRGSNSSCPVGSGGTATGFGMANANAFSSNSIGVGACNSNKNRVQANNSGQSFLMDRLNGVGGSMPPSGQLSGQKRNLIKDWIDQGANTTR